VTRSGIVIPQQPKWHGRLGARAIHLLLSGLASTWRIDTGGAASNFARDLTEPVIFASWHNRLAVAMEFWARIHQIQPGLKLGALVSASRDGGLLAKTLEHFQVQPVRGSSSRRGPQALREAVSLVQAGYCVAITPDGPRGPKYQVKPGIVALAQLSGRPIVATGAVLDRRFTLRSWDAFQVPLPFSRARFAMADPMIVPRDADEEERERLRAALESTLLALNPD
jgi:lysophospholipid acyltransferase (LPLAT)-like uncharacterized protein